MPLRLPFPTLPGIPHHNIEPESPPSKRQEKAKIDAFKVGSAAASSHQANAEYACKDNEQPPPFVLQDDASYFVDYKKLYEESLLHIQELEDQNRQLKLQQIEINTAKELYLNIFEDFPALIWRSGLDKKCDYFNQTWLEWTGKTLDQELGIGWTNGVHPDDFDECLNIYVEAFDKREPFYMEYRLMDRHGEYRWIADHGRPFHDLDDTFLGYIGSCYDINDKKNNEEMLVKLNANKDKFFSIVAHDLRNPISTFVVLSEFLMEEHDGFSPDEMEEIAKEMHKDSKNTLALLEHLLEWSRAQADEVAFHPQATNLSDLFQEVKTQVDVCLKAKKINLVTKLQTSCQPQPVEPSLVVFADRNMLQTILRNLIMNAIKFTNSGGNITVEASLLMAGDNNNNNNSNNNKEVLITVHDDGIGMTKSQLGNLFELCAPMSRVGTDNEKGSGLGLVICKDFVDKHKGQIWAESEVNKGTKFHVTIPPSSSS